MLGEHEVGPKLLDQPCLDPQRGQPERGRRRTQHGARMGLECEHAPRPAQPPPGGPRRFEHRAVTQVQPVKIAERDDPAAHGIGSFLEMTE